MVHPSTLAQWLELLESRHPRAIDLGLERAAEVWQRMGCPTPAAQLITVAGTNGKGSTTAYISAMLGALGLRCGTYTSPHLFRYNERVKINGEMASDEALSEAFMRVESALAGVSLSYFEFGTIAAFDLMSRSALDFAVLEVGLGGRLDAVNILDADCAVITPIGLDHQEYLGPDRESIGREKAGIIRPGKPVICGEAEPPQSVLRAARSLGAPVLRLGREFRVTTGETTCEWHQHTRSINLPWPPMAGPHQVNNMATAVAAVIALAPQAMEQAELLARGLASASLPGRMQRCHESPGVWVDVGHNPHAATAVAEALRSLGLRPRICVLGMLRDKDAAGVAAALDERVGAWFCAGLEGERGRSGSELGTVVSKIAGPARTRAFGQVESALQAALQEANRHDCILVFGSFLTASRATAFLTGT